ncbi:MAG: hypothetical protein JWO32_826 [Bacteroidetes bacterium]|nr:hypothetical protein [Bacteroidota bacterium]
MRTKSMLLLVVLYTQTVKSQNNFHKYYLEGQGCSGFQQKNAVAGTGGAFGFYLSKKSSIDFRGREIINFKSHTIVGAISVNYRYHFTNGFLIGAGLGHHHELAEHDYMSKPAEAAIGSHPNILHRSGLACEIGYNFKPLAQKGFFSCVYPTSGIMLTYMFDKAVNPLITANFGLKIGLQKMD